MAEQEEKKKSKRPTAEKRMIQNKKQALTNKQFLSQTKTAIRSFESAVANKESAALPEKLQAIHSFMDKGVKKRVFTQNKAARVKAACARKAQGV